MSIVITGVRGQLGGELCRLLGAAAVPTDIDSLDLTDRAAVMERMSALRPRAIINCAAYTQVDRAEKEPELCRKVNVTAVENLVRACEISDCSLVQISTDYVFGGERSPRRPWREDEPPSPQGVYAQTKLAGELAATKLEKHLIIRTCGLYARPSDQQAVNFVRKMLQLSEQRTEISVVADQHCTPTYVPHLARAIVFFLGLRPSSPAPLPKGEGRDLPLPPVHLPLAGERSCNKTPWGVYHITNGGETTWHEFAAEIFRLAGKATVVRPISTTELAAAAPRPAYSVLDTTKYHTLGGPAMPHWKDALREYFADAPSQSAMGLTF
jgi:dTDP-4-dehydrorhamnose reductase